MARQTKKIKPVPGVDICPQAGPQTAFLSSAADIAIYGGAAGGGKTWALLAEPLRFVGRFPRYNAVIFRRNSVQIRNKGGLWDASMQIYPILGATPREHLLEWVFPSGAVVRFAHLEYDSTIYSHQGAEYAHIGFDELTHFSERQFFYLLSRNRTTCGIRPFIRATTNPDADSWVARLLSWWIDEKTGFAIPERSGVLRYFIRVNEELIWADSAEEIADKYGPGYMPKSLTFIGAKLEDNRVLMERNPEYLANLQALSRVERERLLLGNWKIRPSAGNNFRREWVRVIERDDLPQKLKLCRGWDLAGTPVTPESPDPDYTVGVKMGLDPATRNIYVLDMFDLRDTPGKVDDAIYNLSSQDGRACTVSLPQDPGQAGKAQAAAFSKKLARFHLVTSPESGDKEVRFRPFSSACEHGNVYFLRAPWNESAFDWLEKFPTPGGHDDHADAFSRAYNTIQEARAPMRINPALLSR